ncbi:MAG: hypothetical protein MMC23_000871 [Stictis urceolatum]|nr:hypothetical protein [Stictis urceolata]
MQLYKLLGLALVPLTLAIPAPVLVEARDGAAVEASIATVSSSLVAFNQTVTAFSAGLTDLGPALNVQKASTTLQNDLENAVKATYASGNFTQDESLAIGIALINLQQPINSTLDSLIRKKTDFDMVVQIFSLRKTVLQSLTTQRGLSKTLGDEVTKRLVPALQGLAPGVGQAIQASFDEAINAFSVKGSGIELPPLPSK